MAVTPGAPDAMSTPDAGGDVPPERRVAPGSRDLDLTPRDVPSRAKRRWPAFLVIGLVVVAVAFVASRALSDATLFFYNADEAVAKRDELGTDRFRLQGTVEDGTIEEIPNGVEFAVVFNGAEVQVIHQGDPPELFQAGMPVVLEGNWNPNDDVFTSDRMLVKHDEQYDAENEDRLREADEGGQVPASSVVP